MLSLRPLLTLVVLLVTAHLGVQATLWARVSLESDSPEQLCGEWGEYEKTGEREEGVSLQKTETAGGASARAVLVEDELFEDSDYRASPFRPPDGR